MIQSYSTSEVRNRKAVRIDISIMSPTTTINYVPNDQKVARRAFDANEEV